MPRARVEPASASFDVEAGETLLAAAQRAEIRWPTVCQGAGNCLTCYFVIQAGYENFPEITQLERDALVWVRRRHAGVPEDHVRLACQTKIEGDVVIFCKGARLRAPPNTDDKGAWETS